MSLQWRTFRFGSALRFAALPHADRILATKNADINKSNNNNNWNEDATQL